MQNEMLMDDSPKKEEEKNYNSWEISGDDEGSGTPQTILKKDTRLKSASNKTPQTNKNSAAKAASQARSAVSNTNPNIRTGLSDNLKDTGTNVSYTEGED